jgi:23S rRNA (uracil1939-C5)-methyltransferase
MMVLTLKIERPLYRGFFLARHQGKVVMVKGPVMTGETVQAMIEEDRNDYFTASAIKIIDPSPERITPPCKYFGVCGGCHFQHTPYDFQVKTKEEVLQDSLQRIMKKEIVLSESMTNNNQWNYRLRGQFKVSAEGIGLHRRGTRDVVKTDTCLLMSEEINKHIQRTNKIVRKLKIREFHITHGDCLIAMIITRKSALTDEEAERLALDLMSEGLSGLTILRGDLQPLTFGKSFITLDHLGLRYTISPQSFIQNNWVLNQAVISFVRQKLKPRNGMKILDLYAGAGNFSLPLASDTDVVAVEGNKYAIQDGQRNLEINNVSNYRFIRSTAEKFQTDERFDAIILDPPRPGLTNRAMKNVLSMLPERIVYLSCNPTTFARDMKKLLGTYDMESIRLIDFFPQTFHIEALAFLHLR